MSPAHQVFQPFYTTPEPIFEQGENKILGSETSIYQWM
ncbi:hypothetical protein S7335_980 [Synechococcus sp. PCC 7335]|nr:hypothetical protein S7335_980 [Synechococcus sp. PCC 7335]